MTERRSRTNQVSSGRERPSLVETAEETYQTSDGLGETADTVRRQQRPG